MPHQFVMKLVRSLMNKNSKGVPSNRIVVELMKLLNVQFPVKQIIILKQIKKNQTTLLIAMQVLFLIALNLTMEYLKRETLKETANCWQNKRIKNVNRKIKSNKESLSKINILISPMKRSVVRLKGSRRDQRKVSLLNVNSMGNFLLFMTLLRMISSVQCASSRRTVLLEVRSQKEVNNLKIFVSLNIQGFRGQLLPKSAKRA